MNTEDKIQAAFRELDERTAWLDATRNQAPSAAPQAPRREPRMPRRPMMALAAAVMVVGGGAVAINTLADDAQVVETGPTESTETDSSSTTVPANNDTTEETAPDASTGVDPEDETNGGTDADGDTAGQTLTPDGVGEFTSPSGNIACNISQFGASCWIGEKEWSIEQPTHDPFCAESDWGNAVDVIAEGTFFSCYTDFGWPIDAEPLAYGDRMRVGEFECASAENGVTCTNAVGQGFRVSRATVNTFPDPQPVDKEWTARTAVNAAAVEADADDPFLNVRATPDPDGELVAKLPPDYTGMVVTGRSETLTNGAEWIQVLLFDPVAQENGGSVSDGYPNGWVNAALTSELTGGVSVTPDQLSPCSRDGASTAPGGVTDGYVYSVEHARLSDTCDRLVISFGTGALPFLGSVTGEAPSVSVEGAGDATGYVTIDLGPISDAWFGAADNRSGVYLVRGQDDYLDIVTSFPVEDAIVTTLDGRVVVDLVSPTHLGSRANAVALLAAPEISQGAVSFVGVGRPFEAVMDVSIEDSSGEPVEARFSGSGALGTREATSYGLGTTDWISAWGYFELTIEDLAPGQYTVVFDSGIPVADQALRYDVTIP